MEADPLLTTALVCLLLSVLSLSWLYLRSASPPQTVRRTYTATTTYVAEATVNSSQATNLAFPAPSPRLNADIIPTLLRNFDEGYECVMSYHPTESCLYLPTAMLRHSQQAPRDHRHPGIVRDQPP